MTRTFGVPMVLVVAMASAGCNSSNVCKDAIDHLYDCVPESLRTCSGSDCMPDPCITDECCSEEMKCYSACVSATSCAELLDSYNRNGSGTLSLRLGYCFEGCYLRAAGGSGG